jgi:hypothetical protein
MKKIPEWVRKIEEKAAEGRRSKEQKELNEDFNLPPDWQPKKKFGPKRDKWDEKKTPGGIHYVACGFDKDDIPETFKGKRARVIPEIIDAIWLQVKERVAKDVRLGKVASEKVLALPNNLPVVFIQPAIWWAQDRRYYVGGWTLFERFCVVSVWYRSVVNGGITAWDEYLQTEMANTAYIAVGRADCTV